MASCGVVSMHAASAAAIAARPSRMIAAYWKWPRPGFLAPVASGLFVFVSPNYLAGTYDEIRSRISR